MDVLKAREILEIPEFFDEKDLKRNYRVLAMKYHPDKIKENDTNEKFQELTAAYQFLLKNDVKRVDTIFSDIFKTFTTQFVFPKVKRFHKHQTIIDITAQEYHTGTLKQVVRKVRCNCEQQICLKCGGCGYSLPKIAIPSKKFDVCMHCTGDGYTQSCIKCKNGYTDTFINIKIFPRQDLEFIDNHLGPVRLQIEKPYFLKNNQLCYPINITLKESLTGFHKIFKDPFGKTHEIVTQSIVKTNDGYRVVSSDDFNVILVFNVIYPNQINQDVVEQLKKLSF
jgi:hypothetical protein